ncbi:MAG: ABC transporter substrate-binding protein [Arcobacteraceae bacterium]
MNRLSVIVVFFVMFSTQLMGKKDVQWNLALGWKSTLTPLSTPAFKIAELVSEMTDGKFIIKIDGLEKHNNESDLFTVVQEGVYQMAHTRSSNWSDFDINTVWFTGIPLGMTTKEQYAWFYHGGGKAYMTKVYDKFDLLSFPGGDLGSQMGGWVNKEIKTIADFEGLNVNTTGITSEILSMYKVNIKKFPTSEIHDAFLAGKLDMIEGTSPSMDTKMGFHKVAPYYYTSWNKPASLKQFLVNKKAFNELPKNYQAILTTAMKTVAYDLYYENFYASSQAWSKIKDEFPNIKIRTLPINVLKNISRSKELIFKQYSQENPLFKEIYSHQKEFLQKAREWTQLEEFGYIKAMNKL